MTEAPIEDTLDDMFDSIFEGDNSDEMNDEDFEINDISNEEAPTQSGTLTLEVEHVEEIEESIEESIEETIITDATDEEVVESTEEVEVVKVKNTFDNHFTMCLRDAVLTDGMYTHEEFGKMEIVYKQVIDPSNKITDYFSSHCNIGGKTINVASEEGGTDVKVYETSNQMSKKYVLTSLEKLIDHIKKNMTITSEEVQCSNFVAKWTGLTDQKLDLVNCSIERDMFDIYTGMSIEQTFTCDTTEIELVISNSYDGKKAVIVSLTLALVGKDADGNDIKMKDFFTLSNTSSKYLHKGLQVANIMESVKAIDSSFVDDIEILKNQKMTIEDVKSIGLGLHAGRSKEFYKRWNDLPAHYKNLYFTLVLLSSILNVSYSAAEHVNLQTYVNKFIKKAHANKKSNKEVAIAEAAPTETLFS